MPIGSTLPDFCIKCQFAGKADLCYALGARNQKPKGDNPVNEYEILIETINPCGGEGHAKKQILEVECESPESYVRANAPYPIMDTAQTAAGDIRIITGDGKGSMVRYTFTEL